MGTLLALYTNESYSFREDDAYARRTFFCHCRGLMAVDVLVGAGWYAVGCVVDGFEIRVVCGMSRVKVT